jgi:hypothetical protein
MAHPPLTVCLFCERPLEPNEPAVFRGKGKLGHIRCWRPDPPAKSPDTSGLPPTGPCAQPDSILAPAAGALEAAPDHRDVLARPGDQSGGVQPTPPAAVRVT